MNEFEFKAFLDESILGQILKWFVYVMAGILIVGLTIALVGNLM